MKKSLAPTIHDVLNATSDEYCMKMLVAIATDGERTLVPETLRLSRKVFYSRVAKLTRNGLIIGRNGKYSLTAFGRIIYNTQKTVGKALDSSWKLRAIDSIRGIEHLSPEDYAKVIDRLLDDIELKDMILSKSVNRHL
jgi:hypothetical protein